MVGFGMGEVILIVSVLAVAAIFYVGLPALRRVRGRSERTELERQVLDELEVLRLRLDMITKRLDDAGIRRSPEEPLLPPGSEDAPSAGKTGDDAV